MKSVCEVTRKQVQLIKNLQRSANYSKKAKLTPKDWFRAAMTQPLITIEPCSKTMIHSWISQFWRKSMTKLWIKMNNQRTLNKLKRLKNCKTVTQSNQDKSDNQNKSMRVSMQSLRKHNQPNLKTRLHLSQLLSQGIHWSKRVSK